MRTKFRKIVAQLSNDIQSGMLNPGDKLPTHRQLAFERGLSLGTATRVFAELEAMGLTVGEIGRGTFVRSKADSKAVDFSLSPSPNDAVDFSLNHMVLPNQHAIFFETVTAVLRDHDCDVLEYRDNIGSSFDRRTAWKWLKHDLGESDRDHNSLIICNGGQHALMLALLACCRPGQAVAVEKYTYPVVRLVCELLRLEVVEVGSDNDGIDPDAFAALCQSMPIRVLFCMPNVQNPTSVTMSVERRKALAKVLRAHDVFAIEDDAYGFLLHSTPVSLSELATERVFFTRTMSKSWAPGLRVCYLTAPAQMVDDVARAQRGSVWMSTPLMASAASRLLASGAYEAVVKQKRAEIEKRQGILRRVFDGLPVQTARNSMHAVLPLPSRVRTTQVLKLLEEVRVIASPISQFSANHDGRQNSAGLRLCIGAPKNTSVFLGALERTRSVIEAL